MEFNFATAVGALAVGILYPQLPEAIAQSATHLASGWFAVGLGFLFYRLLGFAIRRDHQGNLKLFHAFLLHLVFVITVAFWFASAKRDNAFAPLYALLNHYRPWLRLDVWIMLTSVAWAYASYVVLPAPPDLDFRAARGFASILWAGTIALLCLLLEPTHAFSDRSLVLFVGLYQLGRAMMNWKLKRVLDAQRI
jgi:hypothetical protein